jgi:hypothetical protein
MHSATIFHLQQKTLVKIGHIIKKLTNIQHSHTDIQQLNIDREHLRVQQDKAGAFSNYFSPIAKNISKNWAYH